MKKRIAISFLILILLCVALLTTTAGAIMWGTIRNREMESVRDWAYLTADLLNLGVDPGYSSTAFTDYTIYDPDAPRLTIIAPDGTVLLDNRTVAEAMENHAGREEFIAARQSGAGESLRYSDTLKADTYYYAIELDDGNLLRVSKTIQNITEVFTAVLPGVIAVALVVLIAAYIVAARLTGAIVRPLEEVDFDGENDAVYDELIPYVKKIDTQKLEISQQIAALKNRADTIEVITDNMKEGLILIDRNGIILIANSTVSKILHGGGLKHKNILHICREVEFWRGVMACLDDAGAEIEYKRDDRVYSVFFSPVRSENSISGGVIFFFDITERYQAEKQRREFSANVSHELKTPLTSISALAELIENGMAEKDDVNDFAKKITAQTRRLISIIEDIIRLSEFDEGKLVRDYSQFDILELSNTVAESLREKAADKSITVTVTGEEIHVAANKQMIDELLYNLIDNAIKYNEDGGSVAITLSKENEQCKISVSDTGIGIPKRHHSRIFERFYRVDKSRSKKTGGTGLGLSIVKHITEHHGGRIELESAETQGTTVTCWIRI